MSETKIKDRIRGTRKLLGSQFNLTGLNHRLPGKSQREDVSASLEGIGRADVLLTYDSPKHGPNTLINGHKRAEWFPDQEWTSVVLDLTDAEAYTWIRDHDALSALAETDDDLLVALEKTIADEEASAMVLAQQLVVEEERALEGLGKEEDPGLLGELNQDDEGFGNNGQGPAQELGPIGERWEEPPEKGPAEPQPGDDELRAKGVPGLMVHCGDVVEVAGKFPDNYFDAIFCDPPYLLEFMGREFDRQHKELEGANDGQRMQAWHRIWIEACLPKLKPGGNFVAASGSRVYHRLACAAEDAGLDILPMFVHVHGEAMAQGAAIDKLIDKARNDDVRPVCRFLRESIEASAFSAREIAEKFGFNPRMVDHWAARDTDSQPTCAKWDQWLELKELLDFSDSMDAEVWRLNGRKGTPGEAWGDRQVTGTARRVRRRSAVQVAGESAGDFDITAPATSAAKLWEGYATRIKDALGPWVMARKPFAGPSYRNALERGVAGFNVDGCRVAIDPGDREVIDKRSGAGFGSGTTYNEGIGRGSGKFTSAPAGRYPSNVSFGHSEACTVDACAPGCAVAELDRQGQERGVHSAGAASTQGVETSFAATHRIGRATHSSGKRYGDGDSGDRPSRFFPQFRHQAKAGPGERMRGCESFFWKVDRDSSLGFEWITREEWEELPDRKRYQGSIHPTLKPIELCRYLAKLILPPLREDGKSRRVLVLFAGTFSESIGALLAGWDEVVAIEMEPIYVEIGEARAPIWVAGS